MMCPGCTFVTGRWGAPRGRRKRRGRDAAPQLRTTMKKHGHLLVHAASVESGEGDENIVSASAERPRPLVTAGGAQWLEESRRPQAPHSLAGTSYRVASPHRDSRRGGIVALDGPDVTPRRPTRSGTGPTASARRVGDPERAGRRLVTEDLGQGMMRTNVFEQSHPDGSTAGDRSPSTDLRTATAIQAAPPYRSATHWHLRDGVRAGVVCPRVPIHFTGRSGPAPAGSPDAASEVLRGCVPAPSPSRRRDDDVSAVDRRVPRPAASCDTPGRSQ